MGSSAQEQALANAAGVSAELTARENPQHYVRVSSFAAGRYAVTKGEFAAFVRSSGYRTEAEQGDGCFMWTGKEWKKDAAYNWRNVGFAQGDDHPTVCVSWNDAQAYIQWLSRISGKSYRLLSEAEREYAARGGTQTAFWWGDSITTSQANYNGNVSYNGSPKGQYRQATVPVNGFNANPYGLYNMHGNVWEWTQDCWHENYAGAPTDGSAWTTGCRGNYRVLRGGSWNGGPADLRSAYRFRYFPVSRSFNNGFRLARDLSFAQAAEVATNEEPDKKNAEATRIQKEREEAARKERERQRKEQEDKIKKIAKELEIKEQTEVVKKMRIAKNADVEITAVDTASTLAAKISDKYAASILAAIRPNITFDPSSLTGNPAVEILVGLTADGAIISSAVVKSTGAEGWDTAALRAVRKTERLPKDENGRVPPTLLLVLRPRER
jgi:TonB family protein